MLRQLVPLVLTALAVLPPSIWPFATSPLVSPRVARPSIIRRHDVGDSAYLAYGAQFRAVGKVGRMGDATLVAPRWVLTAAHVAQGASRGATLPKVTIGGKDYDIDRIAVHPDWHAQGPRDVALIRLASPVRDVVPLALVTRALPPRSVATIVGHGASGIGSAPERTEDGLRRAATSRIDSTSAAWLFLGFTAPPGGTPLEGAPGRGDSGGPALVRVGRAWQVAGVSSAGFDGRLGPSSYGAVDLFTRVDTHLRWIRDVMSRTHDSATVSRTPPRAITTQTVPAGSGSDTSATMPNSPIGRRASAFLQAMQDGSDEAILRFLNEQFSASELAARPAELRLPNFRRLASELRGTRLLRVVGESVSAITLHLARSGQSPMIIELVAESSAPGKLIDWRRFD